MLIKLRSNKKLKSALAFVALFAAVSFLVPYQALASPINASTLIDLTNRTRQEAGLPPLQPNHKLTQAAYRKAHDILNHGYFSHTTPSGKPFYQWIEEEQYAYLYAGENLAIDFGTNEGVLAAWLESPTHRANIINEHYAEIGLVTLRGEWQDHATTVVVQMFGSLLEDSPTVLGKALQGLSDDLKIRKDDLSKLAADIVLLPSLAGRKYFDVIAKPAREMALGLSNPTSASIAASPITKVAQGNAYRTLLKSETTCCQSDFVFALTEEKNGVTVSTPITYPSFKELLSTLKQKAPHLLTTPQDLKTNIGLAGIITLLLLAAYWRNFKAYLQNKPGYN
ncbi:MAG: hypothetical protein A3H70_03315 [Candidatus Komeilibacteria bacterium RIFCSPLOWO2_02_FULL_48_11]|uniref:SCP domain-containing protein n=1 Tax=Candidatus Komeilibacteria bacterium RIFCSPLOWO2_02_FULL_48_11 TaxID=1798553 RepID=A0A1G2BSS6_9BACT|nr:MAG: hypothetical protein A3H70_03315 [Candidatus Komeilibacteria bacterium RIFCSPLOWO2_02_FULL_48_11]